MHSTAPSRSNAFTLVELLAVIVIISIVSLITLAAWRAIAVDTRHSVAANSISAALANARAHAIEQGRRTMVVFRPVRTGEAEQQIEVVIGMEADDIHVNPYASYGLSYYSSARESQMGLRFEPIKGQRPRMLPEGMMVASPAYSLASIDGNNSSGVEQDIWMSQSNLGEIRGRIDDEAPGVMLGMLFERDGSMRASFTDTGSQLSYLDFNGDGAQRVLNVGGDYQNWCLMPSGIPCRAENGSFMAGVPEPGIDYVCSFGLDDEGTGLLYYTQNGDESEPYVMIVPFFAIYDYSEANAFYGGDQGAPDLSDVTGPRWSDPLTRLVELDEFVKSHGHVYYFNKFTGVVSQ